MPKSSRSGKGRASWRDCSAIFLLISELSANGFSIDHGDEGNFSKGIISFWKSHASEVGAWSGAARIALAMAQKLAGAELVFSLLKILFGSSEDTALSDYIRGLIMLRYNKTKRVNKFTNKAKLGR